MSNISTDLTPRNPFLLSRSRSALLIIDVQEKLMPQIGEGRRISWNLARLIEGAKTLSIPLHVTEQYPQGLGSTISELQAVLSESPQTKRMFSCRECSALLEQLREREVEQVLAVGIETHVCVLQTALDLLSAGFQVFVAVDAVGSRNALDHEIALRRLESQGVILTTVESALFEWCETSAAAEFKQISRLIRRPFP